MSDESDAIKSNLDEQRLETFRFKGFFKSLGPGLITGASDDDPSGIATYSQAGAQFGYGLAWTMLFSYPLMSAVQMISGRIGRTTGHGIAGMTERAVLVGGHLTAGPEAGRFVVRAWLPANPVVTGSAPAEVTA